MSAQSRRVAVAQAGGAEEELTRIPSIKLGAKPLLHAIKFRANEAF